MVKTLSRFLLLTVVLGLTGCQQAPSGHGAGAPQGEIDSALTQLSDADRLLAKSQRFCAVQTSNRLGSMGVPVKLEIEGRPVFLCCDGCEKKARSHPQETLANVDRTRAANPGAE